MSAKYSRAEILERLRDLVESADEVVRSWEEGNLARAVNALEQSADNARDLLGNLKG